MASDGNKYRIIISVDGHKPRCLKCGKLSHIRRDCKAHRCASCHEMTDEHITPNCSYKDSFAEKAKNGRGQVSQPSLQQSRQKIASLHQGNNSHPQGNTVSNVPAYSSQRQQALAGMSHLAQVLNTGETWQLVTHKQSHKGQGQSQAATGQQVSQPMAQSTNQNAQNLGSKKPQSPIVNSKSRQPSTVSAPLLPPSPIQNPIPKFPNGGSWVGSQWISKSGAHGCPC